MITILSNKNKVILAILVVIFPIIVEIMTTMGIEFFSVETSNDWIGFFASYFGSIIGVVGVYLVMKMDQEKREEERKDNLFLQNIELYYKILKLFETKYWGNLVQEIYKLKTSSDWEKIDINTKGKIEKIYKEIDYCSDGEGLLKFLEDYIKNNLYEELKIPWVYYNEVNDEVTNDYDLPGDLIEEFVFIFCNSYIFDFEFENSIELKITKEKLVKKLSSSKYLKKATENIDAIYLKLKKIDSSEEWEEFIKRRNGLEREISNLKESINDRINKLLNY